MRPSLMVQHDNKHPNQVACLCSEPNPNLTFLRHDDRTSRSVRLCRRWMKREAARPSWLSCLGPRPVWSWPTASPRATAPAPMGSSTRRRAETSDKKIIFQVEMGKGFKIWKPFSQIRYLMQETVRKAGLRAITQRLCRSDEEV